MYLYMHCVMLSLYTRMIQFDTYAINYVFFTQKWYFLCAWMNKSLLHFYIHRAKQNKE